MRCHRFLQGRGHPRARLGRRRPGPGRRGQRRRRSSCPAATGKRDGSGVPAATPIAAVAGALPGTVVDGSDHHGRLGPAGTPELRRPGRPVLRAQPADTCSVLSERAGSARSAPPPARFWVSVEQNGPWGRTAATQSYLVAGVGDELAAACQRPADGSALIRRPGEHADARTGPRLCYLAWRGADRRSSWSAAWARTPEDLLRLPFDALARGDQEAVRSCAAGAAPAASRSLLVCTNGRHDVCCAIRGRPVALRAAAVPRAGLGVLAHRRSPVLPPAVLLPHGQTWARLGTSWPSPPWTPRPAESCRRSCSDRCTTGASPLTAPAQAAESASTSRSARSTSPPCRRRAKPGATPLEHRLSRVTHRDGRSWDVLATRTAAHGERPDSCGKAPVPSWQWDCSLA